MAKMNRKGNVKRKVRKPAGCKTGTCKPKKVKTKKKDTLPRGKGSKAKPKAKASTKAKVTPKPSDNTDTRKAPSMKLDYWLQGG